MKIGERDPGLPTEDLSLGLLHLRTYSATPSKSSRLTKSALSPRPMTKPAEAGIVPPTLPDPRHHKRQLRTAREPGLRSRSGLHLQNSRRGWSSSLHVALKPGMEEGQRRNEAAQLNDPRAVDAGIADRPPSLSSRAPLLLRRLLFSWRRASDGNRLQVNSASLSSPFQNGDYLV